MTYTGMHYYAIVGWLVATVTIVILWLITGLVGAKLYKRLIRIYHFTVLFYWLDRLEKEGTHCFKKSELKD